MTSKLQSMNDIIDLLSLYHLLEIGADGKTNVLNFKLFHEYLPSLQRCSVLKRPDFLTLEIS